MAADENLVARLLAILSDSRLHTTADLADQLQISEELVRVMADDLAQHGYLCQVQSDCTPTCSECGLARVCSASGSAPPAGRFFSLTAKGRRVVRS